MCATAKQKLTPYEAHLALAGLICFLSVFFFFFIPAAQCIKRRQRDGCRSPCIIKQNFFPGDLIAMGKIDLGGFKID